jgi:hypothetical protein
MRRYLIAASTALFWCGSAYAQDAGQSGPAGLAEIAAMPPGFWLPFGRPWRDVDPGRGDNCGVDFGSLLGAWNGVVWDDRYVWIWAAGGHGDGCFNGIVRYDLEAGKPEMVVPHLALNVPFCRPFVKSGGKEDCYWEPYVSDEPYPGGMTERVAEWQGAFLRPRSSHVYNNMVKIDEWIYLLTGHIYGSSKPDAQVWRFNSRASDVDSTIERLPDRIDPKAGPDRDKNGKPDGDMIGSYAVNWVQRPGKPPLMFSGSIVCQPDLAAGRYHCTQQDGFAFTATATLAWDDGRKGVWGIDANRNHLVFVREVDGKWVLDEQLSVTDETAINKKNVGSGGLCLVPTENGANPLIWGQAGELLRWDGRELQVIDTRGGPEPARRRILSKWTWREDLGVCLGTWTVDEGFWAYKPDFGVGSKKAGAAQTSVPPPPPTIDNTAADKAPQAAAAGPAAQLGTPAGLPSGPTLNRELKNNPLLPAQIRKRTDKPATPRAGEMEESTTSKSKTTATERQEPFRLEKQWWMDPTNYPSFAGHRVAPVPWQPAAWNQPIERLPEAPDYNALCPGPWAELHYRSEDDLGNSAAQMRGIVKSGAPNVRVYVHPRVDAAGEVIAYESTLKFDDVSCGEAIGVPSDGEKPLLRGGIAPGKVGIIARGMVLSDKGIGWSGNKAANTSIRFIILHDLTVNAVGHLLGVSSPDAPLTYLEFRGNVIGNNTDWHVIYLERSIGQLVALSNVFFGPGRGSHAFKNLAHQSRIEGNVFSNVGLDGQVIEKDKRGREIIGLMPLDLYLCTETIFRNNTVIFRTSGAVRSFMGYRGRRAWGNCDKGQRLDGGRWELWAPESPAYKDPAKWAEISAATAAFDQGYETAKAEPWLFTHKVEGNTFIAFNALERDGEAVDDSSAANVVSLRPVADNRIRKKLSQEARALVQKCAGAGDRTACVLAGMSTGLRYAYDHLAPGWQETMMANGDIPRGVPIPAPGGWVERSGIFWGANDFITCDASGQDCAVTEERPIAASPRRWDALEVAHPPRVIMLE